MRICKHVTSLRLVKSRRSGKRLQKTEKAVRRLLWASDSFNGDTLMLKHPGRGVKENVPGFSLLKPRRVQQFLLQMFRIRLGQMPQCAKDGTFKTRQADDSGSPAHTENIDTAAES